MTWDTFGVDVASMDLEEVCRDDPIKDTLVVTDRTSYDAFKSYCDKLGGEMPVPESMDMLEEIHDRVRKI